MILMSWALKKLNSICSEMSAVSDYPRNRFCVYWRHKQELPFIEAWQFWTRIRSSKQWLILFIVKALIIFLEKKEKVNNKLQLIFISIIYKQKRIEATAYILFLFFIVFCCRSYVLWAVRRRVGRVWQHYGELRLWSHGSKCRVVSSR